ncbi:MAG: LamG-like jellyroll fold domain-containing protein, partial [Flavobacterium sp.]|uniref:LamG-like jellyroll fold domain-containing protein n=1 Tax=Flavobacterium sp. TaxID=239 RepID=UPI002FC8B331
CGLLQQGTSSSNSDLSLAGWGASNDVIVSTTLSKDIWYQYTITYDGTASKIYRNGELLKSLSGITRSTKGNIFRLGEVNTTVGINADIDDLKIYDTALTDQQVAALYNSSKAVAVVIAATVTKPAVLKSKVNTKPAASGSIITNSDVNAGTKNIEVFSQGQKVLGNTSSLNVNDLPEGTYLLKITNSPAKKITSK